MHALIGCELGQNRGHTSATLKIASALTCAGHNVTIALPQRFLNAIPPDDRFTIVIAPSWPLVTVDARVKRLHPTYTMGDVLFEVGVSSPGVLAAVVTQWSQLIDRLEPDIIIADYAPGLLCASRSRLPRISVGTGFTCPPSNLPTFPSPVNKFSSYDETDILDVVQSELRAAGCSLIDRLPQIFDAEEELLATFKELDPYDGFRTSARYTTPSISNDLPCRPGGSGSEIFVYSYNFISPESRFWTALAAPGYPIRIFMQAPSKAHLQTFKRFGMKVEPDPIDVKNVAESSKIVVSHGGHGTICSSAMAGLPTVVGCFDFEKCLNGSSVERMKIGRSIDINHAPLVEFANSISLVWQNTKIAKRTIGVAEALRTRCKHSLSDEVVRLASSYK